MKRPFDRELDEARICVVAIGNPFDGLTLIGPFTSAEAANTYGDTIRNFDWWVTTVVAPSA